MAVANLVAENTCPLRWWKTGDPGEKETQLSMLICYGK